MTAQRRSRRDATPNFNHLRRGFYYRAATRYGVAFGEYLGMEAPYGEWAMLLRHDNRTRSIALGDVTSIHLAA
ncbi:MAG TPA: hypothetical protein VGC47_03250 [Acidimicrobiia bacterium]|jgi:hypothetical protein